MMVEKKSNGCAIAAGLVGLMGVLVMVVLVFGVRGCFSVVREARMEERVAHEHARAVGVEPEQGVIVFEGELPRPEPHRKGEPLARETWLAWSLDERATQFAREAFREAADGSPVDWMLRTEEIYPSEGGTPQGEFGLPVRIEERTGSSISTQSRTLTVKVRFGNANPQRLMGVRRGDWVRIAGRLAVRGDDLGIIDARIVEESEDLPLER